VTEKNRSVLDLCLANGNTVQIENYGTFARISKEFILVTNGLPDDMVKGSTYSWNIYSLLIYDQKTGSSTYGADYSIVYLHYIASQIISSSAGY
jgi:hypothetical protein